MPSTTLKRRRTEDAMRGRGPKKTKRHVKKQKFYHSSSEDDEEEGVARDAPRDLAPVSLESSDEEMEFSAANLVELGKRPAQTHKTEKNPVTALPTPPQLGSKGKTAPKKKRSPPQEEANGSEALSDHDGIDNDDEDADEISNEEDSETDDSDVSEGSSSSDTSTTQPARKVKKRNDPEAFATSISKILNTKLTTQKRSEPILSRSKSAQDANKSLADSRLTHKAQRQLLAERKAAQEKGRVKDVLGLDHPSVSTATTTAKEKELRRTAQRGVIKLFNAVRAAQVKGERAEKESRDKGMVGIAKREEKVKEVSKQGFLDMITGGNKQEGSVGA